MKIPPARILAIIPARGGSKAIPRKNIIDFCGKPMLAWSIEHAKACARIGRIVVSTDDDEIAEVAREWGAEVIERPAALGSDEASSESALVHVLDTLQAGESYVPEVVVFLQATSPLRGDSDLEGAIGTLEQENADSLVSVGPFHGFLWELTNPSCRPMTYHPERRPRRQEIHAEYVAENGSFFVFRTGVLRTYNSRLGGKIAVYRQAMVDSFEINDFEDLAWLRQMHEVKKRLKKSEST